MFGTYVWRMVMVGLSLATTALMGWIGYGGVVDFFPAEAVTFLEWFALGCFIGTLILVTALVWVAMWEEWD